MLRSRQPPGDGGGGGKEGFLFCYARHGEEAGGKEGGAAVASALHSSAELVFHVQLPSAATSSDSTSSSAAVPSLGCAIHGRLTTSVAVVPLTPEACLIITGSEDNTIKLFSAVTPTASPSFTDASSTRTQLSCVATLVDHPDVVRSIAISPEQSSTDASPAASSSSTLKSIHLLFSGGGRDFLHCTRITADCRNSDQQQVTAAVESLGSTGGNVFTNMGRSFGPKRRVAASSVAASASSSSTSAGTAATQKTDVEELRMLKQDVRIMCLTAVPVPSEWMPSNLRATAYHLVVSGNSVGVIKFFLFDSTRHTFRLIAECLQHHYTLLSITQVVLGSEVLVFSGATDGCIRVWKVRELVESTLKADASSTASTTFDSIHSFPAHASGVDCLAVQPLASAVDGQPASSFRLFSGGDDESIHALTARFNSESGQLEHLATRSWPNSHNSAVKSLALLDSALFSVSYDQRLRVWTIPRAVETPDGESATVDLIPAGSTLLDVWDLSTVRVIPSSQSPSIEDRVSGSARSPLIVIAGQGLQLLQATAAAQR
jgi:WD40 repeat protein